MTAKERYEARAQQWAADGRTAKGLSDGYALIALRSWAWSAGAKSEGVSDLLQEFIRASEAVQRSNWLDAYFDDRESCSGCGESYRFENVAQCTACSRMHCYKCSSGLVRAANGNTACSCGNGELVG
jgi:hypothetical protein